MTLGLRWASIVLLASLAGCGGGGARSALDLREELSARGLEAARAAAPDLVAEAFAALDDAEAAERAGEVVTAADHRARAALLAETAWTRAEALGLEDARLEEDRAAVALEDEAVRLEAAAEADRAEAARLASARATREELGRALARAAEEEAGRRRSRRLSLDDAHELRAAAAAIRDRARLLVAAAAALGATEEARATVGTLLSRSEEEESDPLAALTLADEAHDAARVTLGEARRARGGATAAQALSLAEAAQAEGFTAVALERGMGIELDRLFASPSSVSLDAAGRTRLERVATLVTSYPDGPVRIEIDVAVGGDGAERTARARGDAVVEALSRAGVEASRLSRADAPVLDARAASPGDRVRVVLVAYVVAASPAIAGEAGSVGDGESSAAPPAEPTPDE